MSLDRPLTPLADMHYLDGYLDFVFNNDDAPDGAWFAMCVSTIEEHWPKVDGHECFMHYLQWKADQPDSNVTMMPSKAEQEEGNGNEESSKEESTGEEEGHSQEGEQEEGEQEEGTGKEASST